MRKSSRPFPTLIAGISACVASVGCDTFYSVNRSVELRAAPDPAAVMGALSAATDVRSAERSHDPSEREPDHVEFTYYGANAYGSLVVGRRQGGRQVLSLQQTWINHGPTDKQIADARALMDKVYDSLMRRIPELPPASEVQEADDLPGKRDAR